MPALIQASFAKGEIASALHGRVDTAAYQIAVAKALNCIVHGYGGLSNRAGTDFCAPVNTHSQAPRMIPFVFKTTDDYMLEFGNLYIRVYRNDVLLTEAAKSIVSITQANPGVVEATAHGYSTGDDVYIPSGGQMTRLSGRWFTVGTTTADTFQLKDQVTGANVDTTSFPAYTSGGSVERVYTITSPYSINDVMRLKYEQSADVMTLTHSSYQTYELRRTGHTSWTIALASFEPAQTYPTGQTVTLVGAANSDKYKYKVTAINAETSEESLSGLNNASLTITGITQANPAVVTSNAHALDNGDEVYIDGVVGMTELNGRRFIAQNVAANTFELKGENSTSYTAYSSAGTARRTFAVLTNGTTTNPDNSVAWSVVSGAGKYAVYREKNGIYGLIGETELLTFADKNLAPDLDVTPPKARNPFRNSGDYPGVVSYYQQRRVFGGSVNNPDTSRFSQTGNTSNFSRSTPLQADDAFDATLNARQVNEIRHYVPSGDLLVLTSGGEWITNSGSDSGFAATTIRQKPQSDWGSSHLRPITAGTTVLFNPENAIGVRSIGYTLQFDRYTGSDMALLAHHMFDDATLVDWAYMKFPDPVVLMVLSDGTMASMTFQQEQEIIAWTRWETDGDFERVATLKRESSGVEDRAYFVVKRKVNGNTVRYVERMHSRRFTDVRDAYFVDCGLSLDSPVDITGFTNANPVVFTAPSHGFVDGDEVDFADIVQEPDVDAFGNKTQPNDFNGKRYTVNVLTGDTFQIDGLNSTAMNAYVKGGTCRKAVLTVSGLDHIEGRDVAVLADGDVIEDVTVTNGAVTLPRKASRVHVGLPYQADIETLNIEAKGGGTMQGKPASISRVTMRFLRTRGVWVGQNQNSLIDMKQREDENYDEPTGLLTGDKEMTIEQTWTQKPRLFLRQRYPLPMTLLALIPNVNVGELEGRSEDLQ